MEKEKVVQENITDTIYQSLVDQIVSNKWIPGDRLPSENELAKQYNVSRITIRATLQKLVAYGVLSVKSGGGYYVNDFDFSYVTQHISSFLLNKISENEFNDYRALIEYESLNLLKDKMLSPSDLRVLVDCCTDMETAHKKNDRIAFATADYAFHKQICKMGGNNLIVCSYDLIGPLYIQFLNRFYNENRRKSSIKPSNDYWRDAIELHKKIVDFLRKGDVNSAQEIIHMFTSNK